MAALDIPNPNEKPVPWDSLAFRDGKTPYSWPADEADAIVEWSDFEDKAELDKKKKTGAAKPRVSKTGGDGIKFSFTMKWNADDTETSAAAIVILDKLRPGAGPFYLDRHPWAMFLKVKGFMVESVKLIQPSEGVLQATISCLELDPDAQAGAGKNVSGTPSRQTALKKAEDEWLARARQAQAFTNNERQNNYAALQARSKETGIPLAGREPKKVQSVFVGAEDIGTTPNVPKQADPPGAASGKIGS